MGGKWLLPLLLLGTFAAAQAGNQAKSEDKDDAAIRKLFSRPAALPGKFAYAEYQKLLEQRGYPEDRTAELDYRSYIASYLGRLLRTPCTVRKIRFTADRQRATAIVDHGGYVQRWFLVRGRDRWRYYDFEMLDWGLRFSDGENLPQGIQEGFNWYQGEKYRKAIRLLRKFDASDEPKTVRAFRLFLIAESLYRLDDNDEALEACAAVDKLEVDLPGLHLLRARAAHDAGKYDQAEPAARKYLDAVGDDTEGYYALGRALRELKREKGAIEAHLAGIKVDVNDGTNVAGLLRALPDDRKQEAVAHFDKLNAPAEWFRWIAWVLSDDEDWAALAVLLEAMRKKDPEEPQLATYEARLAMGRKDYRKATGLILALLPSQMEEDRRDWAESYLYAMLQLNEPFQGYEKLTAGDRDLAWSGFAGRLADADRWDDLERLLAKRKALENPGPALPIWEIELLWGRKQYAEVVARVHESSPVLRELEDRAAWRPFEREVRSLLRLKKTQELLARARERKNPFWLFMAHAAAGETKEAVAAFEQAMSDGVEPARFYEDPDMGPLLLSGAFEALRKKYPQKRKQQKQQKEEN